ncbi:hypothetical protein R1T16_14450 [Flavobacterium sp. DG1-102-2]|uniref:hypothetical protein n=1 Tax=Flavobacterium sp. DG1-102-2 TaxID=3081663 RepID=UPI002949BE90|nr:hypothetical protein [Flavobacterium sp. DG1-102-2]MDV6169634.1 hypothetical protein [Flavobacterium sp. DG1-102-2]
MKLIPYQKLTLTTKLTKREVFERLRDNTGKPGLSAWGSGSLFIGHGNMNGFEIRRNISYRNSFIPYINGKFLPEQSRTAIETIFKPHGLVIGFMIFWLGGVSLGCIAILYATISSGEGFSGFTLIPFGMLIFGLALSIGGFYFEYEKSKKAIIDLLEARVEE